MLRCAAGLGNSINRPGTRATWTTTGDPTMLDEEGAECVLVGVADDPEAELGIDILVA